jgi:phosphoglycolate phosphatase
LDWERYFGRLIGAQDAPVDKPDRAPVDLALAPSGLAAAPEVWFVGDTAMDMRCAHAAGCTAVLVGPMSAGDDFSAWPPHVHVSDLAALGRRIGILPEG